MNGVCGKLSVMLVGVFMTDRELEQVAVCGLAERLRALDLVAAADIRVDGGVGGTIVICKYVRSPQTTSEGVCFIIVGFDVKVMCYYVMRTGIVVNYWFPLVDENLDRVVDCVVGMVNGE